MTFDCSECTDVGDGDALTVFLGMEKLRQHKADPSYKGNNILPSLSET